MRILLILIVIGFSGLSTVKAQSPFTVPDSLLSIQRGEASFYGKRFHKRPTASGEVYDMWDYTAAHKHLPFGTLLKVTNLSNGNQAIVRINDRLPASSKRVIDLSRKVAEQLDMVLDGVTEVDLRVLSHQVIEQLRAYYEGDSRDLRLRLYYEPLFLARNDEVIYKLKF
ncbi:Rare lipoprotein A precursor [Lunatimonas lonarensis]|uniref:Probable endolytic peptidoglycan transglycosylase RlpA n=1 Tax=Lunatimonas lonarensis TaxID=1232681 RepID=R7ZXP7_9BACT|nr:septal ring lytic transglycosylase RlpA family protein [Lunatimonas lonarensis]EON78788.1 Rare lipoprotein A precursor [Lunatimonas lonarensis]